MRILVEHVCPELGHAVIHHFEPIEGRFFDTQIVGNNSCGRGIHVALVDGNLYDLVIPIPNPLSHGASQTVTISHVDIVKSRHPDMISNQTDS